MKLFVCSSQNFYFANLGLYWYYAALFKRVLNAYEKNMYVCTFALWKVISLEKMFISGCTVKL